MNSLQDLNNGFEPVEFTDPRTASVTFNTSLGNGTQNVLEGQSYSLYVAREITDIINYQDANVRYRVNVSAITGATVSWPTLPTYMTITNPSAGQYTVSGIRTVEDWALVRSPTVNLPDIINGTFTVTATIDYFSTSTGWSITTNIQNVNEWSATTVFWFNTGSNLITGVPNLSAGNVAAWTVTVSPSTGSYVASLATNGSGGASVWNDSAKVLTIVGTNTQINSHLNSITMVTNGAINAHMTFTYTATAISDGSSDQTVQQIRSNLIRYLGPVSAFTYNEDTATLITGAPQITDVETTSGGYFLQIIPSNSVLVRTMASSGTLGGTVTFNNTTKRLSIVGTKAQVNDHLTKITITPSGDVAVGFTLDYTVINPQSATQTKTQTVNFGTQHDEVSNINITRTYVNNVVANIFATSTPQITDLDNDSTYTITLTVPVGVGTFSAPGTTTSRTWTYTGTKTQVNNLFSQISFNPTSGQFENTTITYNQSKIFGGSSVQQLTNYSIPLNGPRVAFDTVNATNQSINTTEGATHSVPVGINVIGVNDFGTTTPIYTIDLTQAPGSTVTWPTIPSGCSVTNPSANIYVINGITGATVWNQIKSPTINLNNYSTGAVNYTATVSWSGPSAGSLGWSVTMNITNVNLISTPVEASFYDINNFKVYGTPQITDSGSQSTNNMRVTVTPSISSNISQITSTGTGGTISFNNTTKVLTIEGTLAQVNNRLANLQATVLTTLSFTLTYTATNLTSNETQTVSQDVVYALVNWVISRSYVGNSVNSFYLNSPPIVRDKSSSNIDVIFETTDGFWTYDNQNIRQSDFVFSGSDTGISANLSKLKFAPNKNITSTANYTVRIQKTINSQTVNCITLNLTIAYAGTSENLLPTQYSYTSPGNFTFNFTQKEFIYSNVGTNAFEVYVIGGGGGGSGTNTGYGGGGGGGGGLQFQIFDTMGTNETLIIGSGGGISGAGQSTTAFGLTAGGGGAGISGNGGNSGSPQSNSGATAYIIAPSPTVNAPGGGGGAGSSTTTSNGGAGVSVFAFGYSTVCAGGQGRSQNDSVYGRPTNPGQGGSGRVNNDSVFIGEPGGHGAVLIQVNMS